MDTLLRTQICSITVGTQKLKRELFLMEQCPVSLDTTSQEKGVEPLVRRVIQLEFDVTALMTRYMFPGLRQPVGRVSQILEELWGVFLTLDRMYGTLTMQETQAERSVFHPAELKQLQILWVRLKRLTSQLKKHLEEGTLLIASKRRPIVH